MQRVSTEDEILYFAQHRTMLFYSGIGEPILLDKVKYARSLSAIVHKMVEDYHLKSRTLSHYSIDLLIGPVNLPNYGEILTEKSFSEAGDDVLDYHVYWRKAVRIHSYGTGPTLSVKKYFGVFYYVSHLDLDAQLSEFNTSQIAPKEDRETIETPEIESRLAKIEASTASLPPDIASEWGYVCEHDSTNSQKPVNSTAILYVDVKKEYQGDYQNFHLYFFGRQTSYSSATLPTLRSFVELPSYWQALEDGTVLNALETDPTQVDFMMKVQDFVRLMRKDCTERWNSCVINCFNYLYCTQLVFRPAVDFSEASRRQIIDPVILCAAMICSHSVATEKTIWSEAASKCCSNVAGYGPLDFVVEGPIDDKDQCFSNKQMVLYEAVPPMIPPVSELSPASKRLKTVQRTAGTSVSSSSINNSNNISSERDSATKIESVPPSAAVSLALPSGGSFEYAALQEYPGRGVILARMCVDGLDEDQITNDCLTAIAENTNMDLSDEDVRESVIEAKIKIILRSICQMAVQLHDGLLCPLTEQEIKDHKLKEKTSADKAVAAKQLSPYRYGVLTSGQTYLFFGMDWTNPSALKPSLVYFGRLSLPVFIYLQPTSRTTGSEKVVPSGGYNRVKYEDFETVVAAIVMMMTDVMRVKVEGSK